MKKRMFVWLCALVLSVAVGALAEETPNHPGFDKIKTLVGEWDGQNAEGRPQKVSYELISGGTAIQETLEPVDEPPMVTVYTPDGARVAAAHYCSANNAPRMQTDAIDGDPERLEFSFVGGTNIPNRETPHIDGLVLEFQDGDHFVQRWTWREAGNDHQNTIHFTRRR